MNLCTSLSIFLLISPVLAFGISPGVQTLKVNPSIAPKDDSTVRLYWNQEGRARAEAQIVAEKPETADWVFVEPESFSVGPATTQEPDRTVVWIFAEVPDGTPEGNYKYRVKVLTVPSEEEGFLTVRQEAVSTLNLQVNYSYVPEEPGWHEPETEGLELSTPMMAVAVILVAAAAFIFLKV